MAKKRYGKKISFAKRASESLMTPIVSGLVYGAGRTYLSNMAAPITSKIPAGQYADNLLFGGAAYYIAKKNTMGMRGAAKAVLAIESAMVGAKGFSGLNGGSSSGESGF